MARAVYQHELQDQDFSWLVQRFQETYPEYVIVESSVLPIVLFRVGERRVLDPQLPLVLGASDDVFEDDAVLTEPEA